MEFFKKLFKKKEKEEVKKTCEEDKTSKPKDKTPNKETEKK